MKKRIKQSTLMRIINIISITLAVLALVALYGIIFMNKEIDRRYEVRHAVTTGTTTYLATTLYATQQLYAYVLTSQESCVAVYEGSRAALEASVLTWEDITPTETALVQQLRTLQTELAEIEGEVIALVQAGDNAGAAAILNSEEYTDGITQVNALMSQITTEILTNSSGTINQLLKICNILEVMTSVEFWMLILIQIYSIVVVKKRLIKPIIKMEQDMTEVSMGVLGGTMDLEDDTSEIGMLVHSIRVTKEELSKYIQDISDKLEKMAQGDFDQTIDIEYIGDFQPIQISLEHIIQSLNDTFYQIDVSSSQVSTGAAHVAANANDLAAGATEQASAVEQLSASIAQISGQIQETADRAQGASQVFTTTEQQLEDSDKQMKRLLTAMDDINSSSLDIQKIIKTIEDIAFQTNILALNAAVEAARAGSVGKGFAVVADEVRNLATKSADAAKTTTSMIESSVKAVNEGINAANETANTLDSVVESSRQVSESIGHISVASTDEARAISEVNVGVDQISKVIQSNSASSEQGSAAAEELNGQAEILKEIVEKFKIRKTDFVF